MWLWREFYGLKSAFEQFNLQSAPSLQLISGGSLNTLQLKALYLRAQAACHPDNFALSHQQQKDSAARASARLTQAYKLLSDDLERVRLWLDLSGVDLEQRTTVPDMALFELQMELNELLGQVKLGDLKALSLMEQKLEQIKSQSMLELDQLYTLTQTSEHKSLDQKACLQWFGRLAMVSRLTAQVQNRHYLIS